MICLHFYAGGKTHVIYLSPVQKLFLCGKPSGIKNSSLQNFPQLLEVSYFMHNKKVDNLTSIKNHSSFSTNRCRQLKVSE